MVRALLAVALSTLTLTFLMGLLTVYAQDTTPDLSPELQAHATQLDKQLMCPVCPSETLNQSQATLAKQMRAIIRQRLAEGQTPQQISDYFVSVYGHSVLAQPPTSGIGLAVWVVPPAALAIGAAALVLVLRSMRRRTPGPVAASEGSSPTLTQEDGLRDYLRAVDKEMDGDAKPRGM